MAAQEAATLEQLAAEGAKIVQWFPWKLSEGQVPWTRGPQEGEAAKRKLAWTKGKETVAWAPVQEWNLVQVREEAARARAEGRQRAGSEAGSAVGSQASRL